MEEGEGEGEGEEGVRGDPEEEEEDTGLEGEGGVGVIIIMASSEVRASMGLMEEEEEEEEGEEEEGGVLLGVEGDMEVAALYSLTTNRWEGEGEGWAVVAAVGGVTPPAGPRATQWHSPRARRHPAELQRLPTHRLRPLVPSQAASMVEGLLSRLRLLLRQHK